MLNLYRYPFAPKEYKAVLLKRKFWGDELEEKEPVEHEHRLPESLSRSRRLIRDIAWCNYLPMFATFTMDEKKVEDRYDFLTLKRRLMKFFNNYRTRQDADFRYLCVPEYHKDGAVHFHSLIKPPLEILKPDMVYKRVGGEDGYIMQVPNTPGYLSWPRYERAFGNFNARVIDKKSDYADTVDYLTKYVSKALQNDYFKGAHVVMHSKGLDKPLLVKQDMGHPDIGRPDYEDDFCALAWRDRYQVNDMFKYQNGTDWMYFIVEGDMHEWTDGEMQAWAGQDRLVAGQFVGNQLHVDDIASG